MSTPTPAVPVHRPLAAPLLLFLGLAAASVGLLLLSAALAQSSLDPVVRPLDWLARLDVGEALSNAAEVVAAVLAIAITVVAIVVELAANRYSHQITRLFLREPVNLLVLGLLVLTTVQCVWAVAVVDDAQVLVPQAGFAITLGMVTLSLLLLVPYIYFVFTFLSPISVIQRICRDAYRVLLRARHGNVQRGQHRVEEAVDQLHDVARSAIAQGDRSVSMAAVDALAGLMRNYVQVRDRLPRNWLEITDSVAEDPDFVALAPESMEEMRRQGFWLERKILRRYLSLMGQSTVHARDVANLIGINTRRFASEYARNHPHVLELCIRTFNSYLRTTIAARDPRTAYFLMSQYAFVAVRMLREGNDDAAVTIAGHLRWYGQFAHKSGIPILLETAAYDVTQLIENAIDVKSPAVDALLDCLLELDLEIKEDSHEKSLLGVRRAQMQIATVFLMRGDDARVERIVVDLAQESRERLERLRRGLMTDDRPQYWELMDRGVNFAYLSPDRRPYLDALFDRMQRHHIAVPRRR